MVFRFQEACYPANFLMISLHHVSESSKIYVPITIHGQRDVLPPFCQNLYKFRGWFQMLSQQLGSMIKRYCVGVRKRAFWQNQSQQPRLEEQGSLPLMQKSPPPNAYLVNEISQRNPRDTIFRDPSKSPRRM
jgi:hypothetical protein